MKTLLQGFSIITPLNIDYQIQALKSLRKGIEDYDQRRGWRGAITNKTKNINWENKIFQYKLDPTLQWNFAEIVSVNDSRINFRIINEDKNNLEGDLLLNDIKWTLRFKKSIQDVHKVGDIIFIKKIKINGKLNSTLKLTVG